MNQWVVKYLPTENWRSDDFSRQVQANLQLTVKSNFIHIKRENLKIRQNFSIVTQQFSTVTFTMLIQYNKIKL